MSRERAPDEPEPEAQGRWSSFELQASVALASLLTPLNSTVIAVGLPAIREHFEVGVGAMTLLISIYLVAVAVMQPVSGRFGDAFGSVRVMWVGLVLLIIFSAASAFAWNFPVLIITRALQGVASALVMPNAIALLRKRTPSQRLATAFGTNGAALSAAAALGPVVGGGALLIGDWRLLFLLNVPLSLAAIAFLLRLPADAGGGRAILRIDLPSFGALTFAFASVVVIGSAARVDNPTLLVAGTALLPLAATAYWLRARQGASVVDLSFFRQRNFRAAAAGQALTNLVMYSFLVGIPLYLAGLRDVNDQTISLVLFALSAAMIAISPLGGVLADRAGRQPLVVGGSLVIFAATIGLVALFSDPPLVAIVVPLVGVGVGLGISGAARSSAALEAWPRSVAGAVSGTFSMTRYVGSVAGAAMIAALLGANPDEAAFRILFAVLVAFAVLNVVASLGIRDRRPTEAGIAEALRAGPEPIPPAGRPAP